MNLHEAIEKLLKQTGRPMTAREIADKLNKNKWYVKIDGSNINPSQITARVDDHHELFDINRSVSPLEINIFSRESKHIQKTTLRIKEKSKINNTIFADNSVKFSFDYISNSETIVLILGTIPGDKSLELGEYYGHPRNKFWRIISTITSNELPISYSEKKLLLLKTRIGIWDVAHNAIRKGSLDREIKDEKPNDLDSFITEHKNLKVIGFNGTKSEALFDKYFERKKDIKYISLPSTSPANTGIDFDNICIAWRKIVTK